MYEPKEPKGKIATTHHQWSLMSHGTIMTLHVPDYLLASVEGGRLISHLPSVLRSLFSVLCLFDFDLRWHPGAHFIPKFYC